MTDWATFAVATVVLTLLLLYFTRRSRRTLERIRIVDDPNDLEGTDPDEFEGADPSRFEGADPRGPTNDDPGDPDDPSIGVYGDETDDDDASTADPFTPNSRRRPRPTITTALLLANVTVSQGIALTVLVAVAWWTGVPASAFGLAPDPISFVLGWGVAAGALLYVGNEAAAAIGERVGVTASERLRQAMAPTDAREWAFLLVVVLPTIALFEEALFRGALIGALALGFGIDPWLLAVGSSVVFGLGHGAQGRLGIAVTGALGLALAALFIHTGSLLVVVVAHYVVNALEFVVREGIERDPAAVFR